MNNGVKRKGVLGNNRSTAVISYQIVRMMPASIENIARQRGKDVDMHESDMGTDVHKETERSQAREK